MDRYDTESIRNVALVAHSGAGKTSLAEALYFVTGKASRLGRVEEHNTISDYDPDEHERGMSINLAAVACEWNGSKINIIDTPGYADFVGEVISGLNAADAAAVLVDATAGIEVGTEIVWRLASDLNRPRLLDRESRRQGQRRHRLGCRRFARTLRRQCRPNPGTARQRSRDSGASSTCWTARHACFGENGSSMADVPDDLLDTVEEAREQLVEAVASTDDDLLEQYLEGEELQRADLERALRTGIADGSIYPGAVHGRDGSQGRARGH